MWKNQLRPLVQPLPQWSTVALAAPQQAVTATLHWDGRKADVTADHTVASLKPLIIASSLDADERPLLKYSDSSSGELLGSLHLQRTDHIVVDDQSIALYNVTAGKHFCLDWPQRSWNAWLQNRQMHKNRNSTHFNMESRGVQQLMIDYLCPRPVVLVSVASGDHRNIFPMDLIGSLDGNGLYSLALRSTNVSVPTIRAAKQVALSSMPATMKSDVYTLAKHHKDPLQDWCTLPFAVRPSRQFGIPAVAGALRIRELTILHSQEIGSHMFFVGRISSDQHLADGEQLHHTAGFHQAYRRRQGMPFSEA